MFSKIKSIKCFGSVKGGIEPDSLETKNQLRTTHFNLCGQSQLFPRQLQQAQLFCCNISNICLQHVINQIKQKNPMKNGTVKIIVN